MKKYIKSILVLVILIVLPLGSWIFLKKGLDWRKAKVLKLEKQERFINAFDFENADKDKLYEIMAHRTCVVKFKNDLTPLDSALIDQFKNAYTFQFIDLTRTNEQGKGWSSKSSVRQYKPANVRPKQAELADINYMIVDTSGYIRQFYKGDDKQIINLLVEDVAVVLPRKREKDIAIKKPQKD